MKLTKRYKKLNLGQNEHFFTGILKFCPRNGHFLADNLGLNSSKNNKHIAMKFDGCSCNAVIHKCSRFRGDYRRIDSVIKISAILLWAKWDHNCPSIMICMGNHCGLKSVKSIPTIFETRSEIMYIQTFIEF